MQFTVETQGTSSFLTYCMAEDDVIDSMSMGMITNNNIEGIIPFHYLQMDADRYLKYNISSKISLSQYFNGVVNKHRLLTVMKSIAAAVLNAEEYMLDAGVFVWNKEYIFVDAATSKASLICVPIEMEGKNGKVNLEQFFRQLLLSVQFDQSENGDYVAKLLGFFNTNTHFSLTDFHNTLTAISNGSVRPAQNFSGEKYAGEKITVESKQVEKKEETPVKPVTVPPASEGGMVIPGINIPEKTKESKVPVVAEEKKEKKGFSLFGSRKKEDKKEEKADKKEAKKEKEVKKGKEEKKTTNRQVASFNGMRIPGQENDMYVATPAEENTPVPTPAPTPKPVPVPTPVPTPKPIPMPVPAPAPVNYDDDRTEIADSEVTEIADDDMTQVGAWLELMSAIQPGAMERIDLDMGKQSILLGRASSDVLQPDVAFPGEFRKIGRQHARIDKKGAEYYITDLGSVNHTLLDGVILTPNQPYLLRDGAELTLTTSKSVQYRVHI